MERFTEVRDEDAFGELVSRHGPMVMSTCRRRLRNEQDCQDAFQATFLTLVTKAKWIRQRSSVAGWLQKVAVRIVIDLQRKNMRRRTVSEATEAFTSTDDETALMIEEELARLPANYRNAIVLCHLEGHTNNEAAKILDVPRTTLSSWLSKAREQLRKRLVKQGVPLTVGGLTAGLVGLAGGANTLEAGIIQSTSRAATLFASGKPVASAVAASLAKTTINKMILTKTTTVTLIATMLFGVLFSFNRQSIAQSPMILIDDFETGDDGWTQFDLLGGPANGGPGIFDAGTGEYTLNSTSSVPAVGAQSLYAEWNESSEPRFSDGFLQATVRANNEGSFALLAMRVDLEQMTLYQFGASAATNSFSLSVRDADGRRTLGQVSSLRFGVGEDWIMQAGAVDNEISLKVWRPGEQEPAFPQLVVNDSSIESGSFGLVGDVSSNAAEPAFLSVTFDDVKFRPVPEPTQLDFNNDSNVDTDDIDALVAELVAGTNAKTFDLTGEGIVDDADLRRWLSGAATHNGFGEPYLPGDSNLDGVVDATDLNNVAVNWNVDEAAWSAGDFSSDGVVDARDLNAMAANWRQAIAIASTATAPVPEPSAVFLVFSGLALTRPCSRSFR